MLALTGDQKRNLPLLYEIVLHVLLSGELGTDIAVTLIYLNENMIEVWHSTK
jgi:hypothetical protein